MNTRDIEVFLAVVETGSVLAAATRLRITQPAVTRRVQSLEEFLGAELLDRQSKPLKATPAGRRAYEHGRSVLRALEDLKSSTTAQQEPIGEFRLGVTPCLFGGLACGALGPASRLFPEAGAEDRRRLDA